MSLAPLTSATHAPADARHLRPQAEESGFQTILDDADPPTDRTDSPPSQAAAVRQAKDQPRPTTKPSTLQTVSGRQAAAITTSKSKAAVPGASDDAAPATLAADEKKTRKPPESGNGVTPTIILSATPDMPAITAKPAADDDIRPSGVSPASVDEATAQATTSVPDGPGLKTVARISQTDDPPTNHASPSQPDQATAPALPVTAPATDQIAASSSATATSGKASAPTHEPAASTSTTTTDMSGPSTTFASYALKVDAAAETASASSTDANLKKTTGTVPAIQSLEATGSQIQTNMVTSTDQLPRTDALTHQPVINLAPAALSATITALHQAGQTSVLLRLDPPELGHLSVQVKMDAQGAVNVLFIPSTAEAAQALHGSLGQLGNALVQSGLTLGQAEVGGQFSQSGGQNHPQGFQTSQRQAASTRADDLSAASTRVSGLSAYA